MKYFEGKVPTFEICCPGVRERTAPSSYLLLVSSAPHKMTLNIIEQFENYIKIILHQGNPDNFTL